MKPMAEAMALLVDELNDLAYRYYVLDEPRVSDAEYDKKFDDLLKMEAELGYFLPNSPTQRVGGATLTGFQQHKHLAPLYSLDKVRTIDDLRSWAAKIEATAVEYNLPKVQYALEMKFDGLTINLTYNEGNLIQATTRGDGETGECVLEQVKTIKTVPLSIPYKGLLEAQGEAYMPLSALAAYNAKSESQLKNARNAVAGAIRNLNPKETAARGIRAFFYNVNYIDLPNAMSPTGGVMNGHMDMMEFLRWNKFPTNRFLKATGSIEQIIEEIDGLQKQRSGLDYLIDGAVIKVIDFPTRDVLGWTNRYPRWAIAWKFEAEELITTIRDVVWEVGRTGKLTPVAEVDPIDIGGATIRRATLNNAGDVERKQVKINGRVWIRRSNDVIPEIMGSAPNDAGIDSNVERNVIVPVVCPACGAAVIEFGAHIFCSNTLSCPPQIVGAMTHLASKDCLDIDGLSEQTIKLLFNAGMLKGIDSIFYLHTYKDEMCQLAGVGVRKVEKLLAAIEAAKNPDLKHFIYALGMPNSGEGTAKRLAKRFGTFDNVFKATYDELMSIQDIGDIVATSIRDFFDNPTNIDALNMMYAAGVRPKDEVLVADGVLKGKTVVVTGTLPTLGRKEAEELVEKNGGKVSGSVSAKTSFVLVGENAGSKQEKAVSLGIPCISQADFLEMIK